MYFCDKRWYERHAQAIKRDFRGKIYTQYHNPDGEKWARSQGITAIQGVHHAGVGKSKIHFGSNSGIQAINLCYLLTDGQVSEINLLGYDMGKTGGKNHWFGDHPPGMLNGHYEGFIGKYDSVAKDLAAEGIMVTNYSRHTKLTQFERASLDDL